MTGPDLSGEVLDRRYQIVERLSEGAMGVVYRGVRTKLERPVAIKVMHVALPGAMKGRKRFEREAQLMARLDHPHCVSIIDYGIHKEKPYVVMELVRGQSLHDMLGELGRLEIPKAVDILQQVLSGLAHAHDQGVIHRDIKPANIMITPKAPLGMHVRILDFGLARMLEGSASLSNGVAVGTPSYMAPEQCRGEAMDARVDVYACGIVLFEMLTGKKPLTDKDPIAILKKQIEEPPPKLADVVPGDYGKLEAVVARALAKAPADRYPTVVAMAEALEAAVSGKSAAESTAVMPAQKGPESSLDLPITVATSAFVLPPKKKAKPGPVKRPMAPVSKKPKILFVLFLLAAVGGAIALIWPSGGDDTKPATKAGAPSGVPAGKLAVAADPAAEVVLMANQLAETGKADEALALLADGRKKYPDQASLPMAAGKLYFARYWWNDGIAAFRDAIKIDRHLREDKELIATAVKGFLTTPGYDDRLGNFLVELGPAAVPALEETAKTHPNPNARSRAGAMAKRIH